MTAEIDKIQSNGPTNGSLRWQVVVGLYWTRITWLSSSCSYSNRIQQMHGLQQGQLQCRQGMLPLLSTPNLTTVSTTIILRL